MVDTIKAHIIKTGKYGKLKYYVTPGALETLNGYVELPDYWEDGKEDDLNVYGGITFKGYLNDKGVNVQVIGFDTLHLDKSEKEWTIDDIERECRHLVDEINMLADNSQLKDWFLWQQDRKARSSLFY
ncbi:hypothetical protein [Ligilactobacillus salivarius]|uniref:hypothetical protein n=1 Tax=Ligilactobacillus salivarius TaxID=1624 RepID=UPI0029666CB0|nr:hypothetical protein [Ligilactobacillus salivarius]MDW3023417.1 hypothetical protein [Ligilactobacillus salivarius]